MRLFGAPGSYKQPHSDVVRRQQHKQEADVAIGAVTRVEGQRVSRQDHLDQRKQPGDEL